MFKKVVSIVVAVACLLCMTSAFAAVTYENAKTSYIDNNKIQVTSQIISGAAGDVTTYLVHDKEVELANITSGNQIVYVDQHTAACADEEYTFVYNTSKGNIGASIAYGGNVATPGDNDVIPGYVRVVDNGNVDNVYYNFTPDRSGEGYAFLKYGEGNGAKVPEGFVAKVESPSNLDAFVTSDGIYILKSALSVLETDGLEVKVSIDTEQYAASTDTLRWFAPNEDADVGYTAPSVVVTGWVKGAGIVEYGVMLSNSLEAYKNLRDSFSSTSGKFGTVYGAQALPALAKNAEGRFGVRVYSEDFTESNTVDNPDGVPVPQELEVYAMVYGIQKNGENDFALVYPGTGLTFRKIGTAEVQAVVLNFDDFIVDDEEDIIFDDPYGEGIIEFEE